VLASDTSSPHPLTSSFFPRNAVAVGSGLNERNKYHGQFKN
jgi:hypothetical protein